MMAAHPDRFPDPCNTAATDSMGASASFWYSGAEMRPSMKLLLWILVGLVLIGSVNCDRFGFGQVSPATVPPTVAGRASSLRPTVEPPTLPTYTPRVAPGAAATAETTAASFPTPTVAPTVPTRTPVPAPTVEPPTVPTYTPSPSLKATATPTPRPTVPTPTSVPTPVPTEYEILQQPDPVLRHLAAKQHLLERTNDEREKAGVPTVKMGENPAAQLHAEAALRGCYSSYWDRWGLKPNARYVLSGGTGSDGENLIGSSYCITSRDFYTPLDPIEVEIDEAVQSWIESPGHQANMLNPSHTELNLGIAYDRYNIVMVQHFASDYVSYEKPPAIDDRGRLSLKGKVEGATMEIGDVSSLIIAYDPPPRMLARGQLARTYALCAPTRIGYLLKPLPPGWTYEPPRDRSKELRFVPGCVDPYETDPDRDAPSSPQEALMASVAYGSARLLSEQSIFWMTEPPERTPYEVHRER